MALATKLHFSPQEVEATDTASEIGVVVANAAFISIACTRYEWIFVKQVPGTTEQVQPLTTSQFHIVRHRQIVPGIRTVIEIRWHFRIRDAARISCRTSFVVGSESLLVINNTLDVVYDGALVGRAPANTPVVDSPGQGSCSGILENVEIKLVGFVNKRGAIITLEYCFMVKDARPMSGLSQVACSDLPHPVQGHVKAARSFRTEIELTLSNLYELSITVTSYIITEWIRIAQRN